MYDFHLKHIWPCFWLATKWPPCNLVKTGIGGMFDLLLLIPEVIFRRSLKISLVTWKSRLDLRMEESSCHKMVIRPLKRFKVV